MKHNDKDFLLFYEWYLLMKRMSHKNAHLLLNALVEYQNEGKVATELPDKIRDVADLMFKQIDRRKYRQAIGSRGGTARAKAIFENTDSDYNT